MRGRAEDEAQRRRRADVPGLGSGRGTAGRRYRYGSGREGEWFVVGFSPRRQNLTLYIMDGFAGYQELLGRLGKHSTGMACLYLKRLDDADPEVLRSLIAQSVEQVRARDLGPRG